MNENRTEQESSLEQLKIAQQKLVETERFEATNRFLMELAHRLDNPLGECQDDRLLS